MLACESVTAPVQPALNTSHVSACWLAWKKSSVINTWRNDETNASDNERKNTNHAHKRNHLSWELNFGSHNKIKKQKHAKNPWKWKITYPYLGNKKPRETNMKFRITSPNWPHNWKGRRTIRCVKTLVGIQSSRLTDRQIETTWQANLSRGQINK